MAKLTLAPTSTPRIIAIAIYILSLTLLPGCVREDSLDHILSKGELRVISRNGPTTFYEDKNGQTGFEYALAELMARDLGVKLKINPSFSIEGIFDTLLREKADIAAAGLTLTGHRGAKFPHSAPYYTLIPQVIYKAGTLRPRSIANLGEMKILVLAGSSHAHALQALHQGGRYALNVEEIESADTTELLERVKSGYAELAVLDSIEFKVQQTLYPRLKVAFDLGGEQDLAWFLPPGRDNTRLILLESPGSTTFEIQDIPAITSIAKQKGISLNFG